MTNESFERNFESSGVDSGRSDARCPEAETSSAGVLQPTGESRAARAPAAAGLVKLETSDTGERRLVIAASHLREFAQQRRQSRMCRSLLAGADLQARAFQRTVSRTRCAFITLTYRPGCAWRQRDLSEAMKRFRHWCARRNWRLAYQWKAELQKRGAVHFHVMAWLPHRLAVRRLELDTLGWWPHGMTNFEWARNAAAYTAKYLSKSELARMPKGIRMHGRGGMDTEVRRGIRYRLLPRYVRDQFPVDADVVKPTGGGWLERSSGQWVPAIKVCIDWRS